MTSVYTIDPERVYTIEASEPKKEGFHGGGVYSSVPCLKVIILPCALQGKNNNIRNIHFGLAFKGIYVRQVLGFL